MLQPSPRGAVLLGLAIGLSAGLLTSFLQDQLEFPWLAIVNAASPWLTIAFVAGVLQPRLRTAMWMGLAATALQVVGYYTTAQIRGFSASLHFVTLWSICAVVGGPVFGVAGFTWRRADPAGLGAALLVAAYASEALVAYQVRLGYTSTAVLFGAIALLLAVGLGRHRSQFGRLTLWLPLAFVAGVTGQAVLGLAAG